MAMKPLPTSHLTPEDCAAWLHVLRRTELPISWGFDAYLVSDRRDAALMLEWQTYVSDVLDHGRLWKSGIDFAGMVA